MKISEHKYLIGSFSGGDIEIDNTSEKIADFICTAGLKEDLVISTPDGTRILNTFGLFIDRCCDPEFLEELKKVLIPKQIAAEKQSGLPECSCCLGDVNEYCGNETEA